MWWILLFSALVFAPPAQGSVPGVQLSHAVPQLALNGAMSVALLPGSQPADPESFWHAAGIDTSAWPAGRWQLTPGQRVIGRTVLQSLRERDVYVVQVPRSDVDHVQVWWREPGKGWHAAEAGDQVPLSRWPFYGQFPAFPIAMTEQPVELIVTAINQTPMHLPIVVKTDAQYREARLAQANLAGLAMGLGVMGAVVSLVAAVTYRRRSSWVLLAYSVWAIVLVASTSGYAAIWFTPEWPAFNDVSKPVAAAVMGGLLVAAIAELLDHLDFRVWVRRLGPAAVAASLLYAAADALWIPAAWRPAATLGWTVACAVLALSLCLASYLRGGGQVSIRVAAIAAYAAAVALGAADIGPVGGLDAASLLAAMLYFASPQLLRHGQFLRERYGRDVLGRAAVSAHRDPLTAVLSFSGLQLGYEEAQLRQSASRGGVAMLMFALPKYDEASIDHGFLITERALVRLAAALLQVLGHDWQIGRLSKTRFGAVSTACPDAAAVVQTATRVLSHCSRMNDPLSPVGDFDLRIVGIHRGGSPLPFMELLRLLEDTAQGMTGAKRIALAQAVAPAPAPKPADKGATVE